MAAPALSSVVCLLAPKDFFFSGNRTLHKTALVLSQREASYIREFFSFIQ